MSCIKVNTAKPLVCLDNAAGIIECWIANAEDVTSFTVSGTSSKVTAINMAGATGSTVFYNYQFKKGTGDLSTSAAITGANGTVGYTGTLKLKFFLNSQENFDQLDSLVKNELYIVTRDVNEKYWLLGEKQKVSVSALNAGWGQNITDFNGQDIEFTFTEKYQPRELASSSVITAVS
ncbi:MAG TPA: hypothetical protein VF868_15245 [Bacteroidia bacterium]|jgi:hypothetical protein